MCALALLALLVLGLTGCIRWTGPHYVVSPTTVQALRAYRGQTVAVGFFSAAEPGRRGIDCRGGHPVVTPTGETYEGFIRQAFVDELAVAEVFAPAAPVTLTGYLHDIDFSSGLSGGRWTISLTLRSSTGHALSLRDTYAFPSAFDGTTACLRVAHALSPAVQGLVAKFVHHPEFPLLMRPTGGAGVRE